MACRLKIVSLATVIFWVALARAAVNHQTDAERAEFAVQASCTPTCPLFAGCTVSDPGCPSNCASCSRGPATCTCNTQCAQGPASCYAQSGATLTQDQVQCDCGCHNVPMGTVCYAANTCHYAYPFNTTTGCNTCKPGNYPNGGWCTACSAGSYCTGNTAQPASCPTGSTSPNGASKATDCMCQAGFYGNNGTACTTCSVNHYCSGGTSNVACPANSASPAGSIAATNCSCAPGYVGASASACTQCPANHFCPGGSAQFACPTGTTSAAGSATASACQSPAGSAMYVVNYGYFGTDCSSSPLSVTAEITTCHASLNGGFYKADCGATSVTEYHCSDANCMQCTTSTSNFQCAAFFFVAGKKQCSTSVPVLMGFGEVAYQNQGCTGSIISASYTSSYGACSSQSGGNSNYSEITCSPSAKTFTSKQSCNNAGCSAGCQTRTGSLGCQSGTNLNIVCAACGVRASLVVLLAAIVAAFVLRH